MTTWLITGCSTGLGRALSQTVLAHGHNAVVTARNVNAVKDIAADYPDTALALPLDVTDKEQISSAVQQAQARFGGIDVLVNNAGYGYRAAVEEADDADIRQLFDTNLFGAVDMTKAVLPSNPARSAPISPAGHSRSRRRRFRIIAETAGKRRKENDTVHGTQPGDPGKAAEAIIAVVESPNPPSLLVLGQDAYGAFAAVADAQRAELDQWRELSLSTGIDE